MDYKVRIDKYKFCSKVTVLGRISDTTGELFIDFIHPPVFARFTTKSAINAALAWAQLHDQPAGGSEETTLRVLS